MDTLQFAQPYWLLAGLIVSGGTLLLLSMLQQKRQATLEKFAGAQLLGRLTRHVSTTRRRLKNILLILAIFLLFSALARPQYGSTWIEVKRKGIDILFALDTSNSMLAEDTKPNRLQRARLGIMDFVAKLEGDRVGLMPFAGTGYLMCPLTLDYDAFNNSLATITTDIIPLGGTNISAVIEEAEKVLENDANHKVLILLTDGENLEGDVIQTARGAKERGLTIYTVGVGTAGGELIPLPGTGSAGFVKDETGKYVTSKLDETRLTEIAEATGGLYAPLGNSGEGLLTIYQQKLQLIPKEELMERRQKVPIERFSWPLAAAGLLLLFEYLLPERKSGRKLSLAGIASAGRRIQKLVPMVFLAFALHAVPHQALASAAEDAYSSGDYLKAAELYHAAVKEHPNDPQLHYNLGTTAYKNNLHDEAIAAFNEALKSDDLSLQGKAYYNRGNALFQKGAESQQGNPQSTREKWQEAIDSYDGALQLNPDDTLARENRAYVAQKLAELDRQIEQNQQQQNNDSQNKQDQEDTNSEKQDQQNQQDQDNSSSQDNKPADDQQQKPQPSDEKQPQEEKDDAQPEEQQADQNSTGDKQNGQPQPVAQENEQSGTPADQDAGENSDDERRELGRMTREEAENLLNALKNEEGELNFVPRGERSVERDW